MQWWCSAQGRAWDWTWQAYPGVWLFVGLLGALYVLLQRRAARGRDGREGGGAASPLRRAAFAAGLLALWAALDWPIGALGAGYLASVHMLQYLLIVLIAPPLMLLGIPPATWERLAASGFLPTLRILTHPLVALALFAVVVYWTHLPGVVDVLMASQAGSFAIDLAWLLAGVVFWWPVVAPVPERRGFPDGLKMGYLFLATLVNTLPYAFLTFGELPFYGIYELAPPVSGIGTREDQQIAGLLMRMGGGLVLWTAITILFFRWFRRDEASDDRRPA